MLKKTMAMVLVVGGMSLFGMSLKTLNHADKATLMEINGIGEAKADLIIKSRKKKSFASFAEVMNVKGIGTKIVENIKNDVKVKVKKAKKGTTKTKMKIKRKKTVKAKSKK